MPKFQNYGFPPTAPILVVVFTVDGAPDILGGYLLEMPLILPLKFLFLYFLKVSYLV